MTQVDARLQWVTGGTVRAATDVRSGIAGNLSETSTALRIRIPAVAANWTVVDSVKDQVPIACPAADSEEVRQALDSVYTDSPSGLQVLYGDTHPIGVTLLGQESSESTAWVPLDEAEAAPATCTLFVASSSGNLGGARLRGGEAFTVASPRAGSRANVAVLCMQVLADRGQHADIQASCSLAGQTVVSAPLRVRLAGLGLRFLQAMGAIAAPSTPQLLLPLRPAAAIGIEDGSG